MEESFLATATAQWPAVARSLGLSEPSGAYPQVTACPLCRTGRLIVLQDNRRGGHWHHCDHCHNSGPVAALVAAACGITTEAALSRLGSAPSPDPKARVVADRWRRAQALWASAAARRDNPPLGAASRVVSRFRMLHGLSPHRPAAPAFGYSDVDEVSAAFSDAAGRARVFPGRGWGDVVVIPYFDLPGRVRGFSFIGRDGDPEDFVYRRVADGDREFGLAGLAALCGPDGPLGNTVVAVPDAVFACRLQSRHATLSRRPLPLVSWCDGHDGLTADAWQSLAGRRLVFWCLRMDAATLRQAAINDAELVVAGPEADTPEALDHYVRRVSPQGFLEAAVRNARPWRKALSAWGQRVSPEVFESLLVRVEDTDVNGLLGRCDFGIADMIARVRPSSAVRTAQVGRMTVVEYPHGVWVVTPPRKPRKGEQARPRLLAGAVLRITEVLLGDEPRCRGHVVYRGQKVEFDEAKTVVEGDTFRFIDRLLMSRRVGIFEGDRTLARDLFQTALRFHTPRVVSQDGRPVGVESD